MAVQVGFLDKQDTIDSPFIDDLAVFAQAVIADYKAGLVPVAIFKGDFKGAVNGKVEMSVIAINGIPETGTKLYALKESE